MLDKGREILIVNQLFGTQKYKRTSFEHLGTFLHMIFYLFPDFARNPCRLNQLNHYVVLFEPSSPGLSSQGWGGGGGVLPYKSDFGGRWEFLKGPLMGILWKWPE